MEEHNINELNGFEFWVSFLVFPVFKFLLGKFGFAYSNNVADLIVARLWYMLGWKLGFQVQERLWI